MGTAYFCLSAWCWLLTIFGFAFKYLNQDKPFIRYANEAVLPFYIMHQTVLLSVAYLVVQWAIPDLLKFLIILTITFSLVMATYELLVRRYNPLRFLFGMKLLPKPQPVLITEPRPAETVQSL
jgi:uncharacterized membrane protein